MNPKTTLAFASFAALSVAAPAYSQTTEQKATLEQARKLHDAEKYQEAASLLAPLTEAFAKDPAFHKLVGENFYLLARAEAPGSPLIPRHFQSAEEALGRYLALNPQKASILNLRGACRSALGRFADAEADHRAAVLLDPRDASYQAGLGLACMEQKKWAEAQVAFTEAVQLTPYKAEFHNFLGMSLFRQDKWSAAEPEFRKALARDGRPYTYALNVGAALLKQGKKADALPFVQEARRLGLKEHWSFAELGLASTPVPTAPLSRILIAQDAESLEFSVRHALEDKSYAEAEALSTKLIAQVPGNPVFFADRAIVRGELKKFAEAYVDSVRAETLFRLQGGRPNQLAWVLSNRAAAALQLGEPYRALAEAFAATDTDPTYAPGWLVRADAYYALGDLSLATGNLKKARELGSTFSRNYTQEEAARNAVGKAPADGNNEKAVRNYNEATKALDEKRYADVEQMSTKLIESLPLVPQYWRLRGIALPYLKKPELAVRDFSTAISYVHSGSTVGLNGAYWLRARAYRDLGDTPAAIDDCKMALKVDPSYAPAKTLLETLQKSAEPVGEAALIVLEAAVDKAALAYEKNFDRKPAAPLRKQLDALLEREPGNAKLLVLRGRMEQITEEITFDDARAMVFFERAVAADPNNADAYYYRGLSRVNLAFVEVPEAKKRETLEDLKKSVALGRSDTETLSRLACAFAEVREWAEATKYITQAIEKQPKEANLYRFRAGYYESQNLWTKALADWSQLIALKPDASSHAGRAMAYVGNKQFAEAFADFERALALDPKDETIFVERARAKRLKGDKAGALADYAKARELDDTIPAVKPDLSDAEQVELASRDTGKRAASRAARPIDLDTGKMLEARARLPKIQARLKRAKEGDSRTDAQILEEFDKSEKEKTLDEVDYRERATVFAKQQKFDEALTDCDKAIALKSGYAPAYNLRGLVYRQKKDDEKALLDFNKAIELEPRSAVYLRNRGVLFASQRNWERALKDLDQSIANDPKAASSYLQRGNVYTQQRNYDAAIADYDKALELDPKLTAAEKNRAVAKQKKGG